MDPNPFLGLLLHAIGGLAAASFYVPLKRITAWSWESFYLLMGIFAWILTPWVYALLTTPDLLQVLTGAPPSALFWTFLFGLLWGVGAVTFGLTMRYLGLALGMSVCLGLTAFFGTIVPPLFNGEMGTVVTTTGGQVVLLGVLFCLGGIAVAGYAGMRKEREATHEDARAGIREFALGKGLLVATVAGVMSACFAYAMQAGGPIARRAVELGTDPLYQNNAVLVVILLGGFTTNTLWCLTLNRKNKTFGDYTRERGAVVARIALLCLAAGVIWYNQFFFYGMGATKMGAFDFSSWSLHMAFIIIFGNLWGLLFREWKGVKKATFIWVIAGIILLVASTFVIGWGNEIGNSTAP